MVVMTIKREDIQALAGRVNSRLPKAAISLRRRGVFGALRKNWGLALHDCSGDGLAECLDFLIGKRVGLDQKN